MKFNVLTNRCKLAAVTKFSGYKIYPEKIQIELTQNHMEYKSYINVLGDVEKLEFIFKDKTDEFLLNKHPKINVA